MKHSSHISLIEVIMRSARRAIARSPLRHVAFCVLLCLAVPQVARATWETLLDGTSFNSAAAFADAWYYNYPWGQTHNGSAKMWSSNDTFSAGVLTMQSVPLVDGTYNYSSGTVYSKVQITVNSTYPTWDISGDFQCESQRGTWPAFWLTGAWGWPPEIDQMEFKGSSTCWLNTYDGAWESLGVAVSSPGNWHTYRVVVSMANATDVTAQFYVDGALKTTQTGANFVGQPMWIIIDYQMEGSSGSPGPNYTTYMRGRNVTVSRDNLATNPPGTPGSLTSAGGNTEIALGWASASDASTYIVQRAVVSGGPYTTIKSNLISTGFTDTGLANGTTYYYVVSAVNSVGASTSAEVNATPFAPAITPPNSGFEAPLTEGYIYNPSSGSWTFSQSTGSGSGVTANGSAFTGGNTPAPQGIQVAFLQATGSISQTFSGFTVGASYIVKFLASQRQNKSGGQPGNTFDVRINGATIGSFEPTQSVTSYQEYTVSFNATAATQTLSFIGTDLHGGDNTVFIDRVLIAWQTPPPVPPAPTGLTAVAVGTSQVNLNWSASSYASTYNVKRANVSGGPYTTVATDITATSYSDMGLSAGTSYYYVVSAVNASGEGPDSVEAGAATGLGALVDYWQFDETSGSTAADSVGSWDGTLANGATWAAGKINNAVSLNGTSSSYVSFPSGFVSALTDYSIAGWFKLNSVSAWTRIFDFGTGTSVNMFLTPSAGSAIRFAITTGSGSGEQRIDGTSIPSTGVWHHFAVTLSGTVGILYVDGVEVGRNSNMTLEPSSLGNTTQNYIGKSQYTADPYLNGLVDDLRIYDYSLNASDVSSLANPSTPPPAAPAGLIATAMSSSQIDLSWNASSGATSYTVKRSATSGGPYTAIATGVTATSYSDTGLAAGTTYYYVVSAVNSAGESPDSAEASATTQSATPPVAPSNLRATGSKRKVTISWTDNSSTEDGFKIERSTDNVNFSQIITVAANTTSYANTGLISGTTYYYRVRAYNAGGNSAYSNTASATAK